MLRYVFIESSFATGFFIGGIIILILARSEIKNQWQGLSRKLRSIVITNQVAAFSGHAFYFSALALASAVLVQSVLNIQAVIVFAIAAILSRINPSLVDEGLNKHDILQKILGIALVVSALFILG